MVAGRWTLLDRTAAPLLDAAAAGGVGILAAAPYNSGLLARDWPSAQARYDYATAPDEMVARARHYARAAIGAGVSLPDLALGFPLRHPSVTSVVVGLGNPDEVRQTRDRAGAAVPEWLWHELDRAPDPRRGR